MHRSQQSKNKSFLALGLIALVAPLVLACDVASILTAVAGTPTPKPIPTTAPTATNVPPVNIITNAVTAKNVSGNTFQPVGITDSFPADQSLFHVVVTVSGAPENTKVKIDWLTASNTPMGAYTLTVGGSRNLDFTFKPDAGKLPPGSYLAQIYVNDKLDRTLSFAVMPATSATAPVAVTPKHSGIITSVTMAEDSKPDTKDPINPTVSFKPASVFHAIAAIADAPANTRFTATWYVVDVGNAAPPGSEIEATDITTAGSRNIDFTLTPKATWPVGSYRVEISVNGTGDTVKTFSVQ